VELLQWRGTAEDEIEDHLVRQLVGADIECGAQAAMTVGRDDELLVEIFDQQVAALGKTLGGDRRHQIGRDVEDDGEIVRRHTEAIAQLGAVDDDLADGQVGLVRDGRRSRETAKERRCQRDKESQRWHPRAYPDQMEWLRRRDFSARAGAGRRA
jgi:hypothetical protein